MASWQSLVSLQDLRIESAQRALRQAHEHCRVLRQSCEALQDTCRQLEQQRTALQKGFVADAPRHVNACRAFATQLASIDQDMLDVQQRVTAESQLLSAAEQQCQQEQCALTRMQARREVLALQAHLSRQEAVRRRDKRDESELNELAGTGRAQCGIHSPC